ncbi:MAG: OmpH family outer membrane protein [Planctomycetes bacterium]|nr:OmpH family outer membrane protein [Planctomycetota bacterium]
MNNKTTNVVIATFLSIAVVSTMLMSNEKTGTIGPADAVILAGSDGDVTVKNSEGRMSWGDKKTSTVWSIGFMETGKALSQLLQADHYVETREELNAELAGSLTETRKALETINAQAQSLEQDDPNAGALRQQWQRLYDKFQKLQKIAADARASLLADQMQESYDEIIEAVNVVSERLQVDMVLRFIPPDGEFEQGNPDSTIMQIRLRSALRLPDGLDITDEVLAELGLDD